MDLEFLFSYGTLQQENVQISTFGRVLDGEKAKICGFKLNEVEISDYEVISKSGKNIHKIMVNSQNEEDFVEGTIYSITKSELRIADDYEVNDYKRVQLITDNGKNVWAYVAAWFLAKYPSFGPKNALKNANKTRLKTIKPVAWIFVT